MEPLPEVHKASDSSVDCWRQQTSTPALPALSLRHLASPVFTGLSTPTHECLFAGTTPAAAPARTQDHAARAAEDGTCAARAFQPTSLPTPQVLTYVTHPALQVYHLPREHAAERYVAGNAAVGVGGTGLSRTPSSHMHSSTGNAALYYEPKAGVCGVGGGGTPQHSRLGDGCSDGCRVSSRRPLPQIHTLTHTHICAGLPLHHLHAPHAAALKRACSCAEVLAVNAPLTGRAHEQGGA